MPFKPFKPKLAGEFEAKSPKGAKLPSKKGKLAKLFEKGGK